MTRKPQFGDFNSIAQGAYSGTADFGKLYARIVSIFGFVIAVVLIGLGIYFIRRKPTFPVSVNFTVKTVTPITVTRMEMRNKVQVPVNVTYYNLTGTVPSCGTNVITLNNYTENVSVGQTVNAYIHPNCENNVASQSSDDTTVLGWILIAVAVVIIAMNALRLFFVNRFKGVAALQGVAGGGNILKHLF